MTGSRNTDDARFAFGENWSRFLEHLDDERISEAERSLQRLFQVERLDNTRMLDIGSGSGLFSLAARRLGATVHSFDYDQASVTCTRTLRDRFFPSDVNWTVEQGSVLDRDYLRSLGTFDIVYSWGVLHHTGAMYDAIANAGEAVRPDGLFAIALYRKTLCCGGWKIEKRWYSQASPSMQRCADNIYVGMMRLAFFLRGGGFDAYVQARRNSRGMDYLSDVRDWLGGYPYESISPSEVDGLMSKLGFEKVRCWVEGFSIGLFGSGCDEYVYRRITSLPATP